jgi:hypothetical protein
MVWATIAWPAGNAAPVRLQVVTARPQLFAGPVVACCSIFRHVSTSQSHWNTSVLWEIAIGDPGSFASRRTRRTRVQARDMDKRLPRIPGPDNRRAEDHTVHW